MRKRRLPPRPEPPEGKMWFMGKWWDIGEFQRAIARWHERKGDPKWDEDPSYNWRDEVRAKKHSN